MLLRNRSRAVTKPGLMADHSSQPSSRQNYATPIPSLFGSPKFRELSTKSVSGSGTEALSLRSPTSILDTRALYLSPMGSLNPFSHEAQAIPISSPNKTHSKGIGIGLALVDSLQLHQNSANPNVLFGTQLGVKIPPTLPPSKVSPLESQTSCVHSGLETKHYSLQSPCGCRDSDSPRLVVTGTGVVCWSAMERCEEYTCVKSHGPTPRTTHIFDNCIVIDDTYSSAPLPLYSHSHTHPASGSNDFLSFCYTCKMHLDHTKDIFIYRGEKAFCSEECRYREMVLDGEGNSDVESNDHASL